MTNVIEYILEQMQSDDEDTNKQSEKLTDLFEQADKKGKKLIDDVLICVCGYSFESIQQNTNSGG